MLCIYALITNINITDTSPCCLNLVSPSFRTLKICVESTTVSQLLTTSQQQHTCTVDSCHFCEGTFFFFHFRNLSPWVRKSSWSQGVCTRFPLDPLLVFVLEYNLPCHTAYFCLSIICIITDLTPVWQGASGPGGLPEIHTSFF